MKTRGAIVREVPGKYEVVDLDLEAPRSGELTVKLAASGLCLSDDHVATGDLPVGHLPMCGGHEGAGTVVDVGPDTMGWEVGDSLIMSPLPGCGRCRYCATGHQNLCNMRENFLVGSRFEDADSFRLSCDGESVGQFCGIGTFSQYSTISVMSAVKVPREAALDKLSLIGCAVSTGWGATVNSAQVAPGDTVIVMGCGGIGNFAVQGAAHAGALYIIAVDPMQSKREAALKVGATHGCSSIDEAAELARELTDGQGADSTVIALGTLKPEHLQQALDSVGKKGIVVVTALGDATETDFKLSLFDLTIQQKRIQGSHYGEMSPAYDMQMLARMYVGGRLKLDEAISKTYTLDQINEGYDDLRTGKNLRGVVIYD